MMEIIDIKNQNHLYKTIRFLQKSRVDFAVLYVSPWDQRCDLITNAITKNNTEKVSALLIVNSFETPELFTNSEKGLPCTSVPMCFFYLKDNRLREYKVFKEVLPSRIIRGFDIFE